MNDLSIYNNTRFLLGICEENKWFICNRRFLLNINNTDIFGQFITSSWFNKLYDKNNSIKFGIFQLNINTKHYVLQDWLNKGQIENINHWIFKINNEEIQCKIKDLKQSEETKILSYDKNINFCIRLMKFNTGFLATLPEFTLII